MALSIGATLIKNLMLGTTQIQKVYLGTVQVWAHEVVVVLSAASLTIASMIAWPNSAWDNDVPKRIAVPAGVVTGPIQVVPTGSPQSASFSGSLTIDVYGSVRGNGGAPNGGIGGNAFWANALGKTGQKTVVNLHPGGSLQAGGGGGGKAGNGGPGVWYSARTITEGPYDNTQSLPLYYSGYSPAGGNVLYWNFYSNPEGGYYTGTSYFDGTWTYQRGSYTYSSGEGSTRTDYYTIYRQRTAVDVPNYTSGGVAPNAGRGQGFDGAATPGGNAVAGGTNAGASGASGAGGAYGQPGIAGANGNAGNNGAGEAGQAGGLAGGYIAGNDNITFNNLGGTVAGRLI